MGLKKLFKPKELDEKASKEVLEKNGVVMKDNTNYHRKKFKFGEFGKYSEQQAQNLDTTLRPVLPNSQTGQGSYDNSDNQGDSNQGYGYDEYASDFKGSSGSNQKGNYGYSYSNSDYRGSGYGSSRDNNSYSYTGGSYSSASAARDPTRSSSSRFNNSTGKERRPKQTNFASTSTSATNTNLYGYQPDNISQTTEANPSSKYGYEPSINNQSTSNGYGFDPYDETSVTAKSSDVPGLGRTKTSNTTATQSTYDPYAPGEEPYADNAGGITSESNKNYGGYDGYQPDVNDYGDNSTIKGNSELDGLSSGVQALQLQKEQTQQNQEDDYDPYGPAATLQAAQTYQTNDLDLNAYEPTPDNQQQDTPYDEDEFDEEVDEDEEELNRIQRQTKDVREDTVNLSRTLVDNLGQANVTATNTLGVLGNQREKIYEMQNNVGTMKVQQRFVDDHVKDLEHYNRGLFHIKVNNPFTRNSRRRAKEQQFLAQRQEDRSNKDKLNNELYQSQRAIMDQMKNDNVKSELQEKYDYDRRVKEAAKYLTKDHDEEDERMEVEIAANVEHAQKLAQNLKKKAQLMNNEISQQNDELKGVSENVDYMDDKVVMTTRRIRGI